GKDTIQRASILEPENFTFTFDQRTLDFNMMAIEYAAPEENKVRYILEGYDKDYTEAFSPKLERYRKLPAGNYTLKVWGANSDGLWTKEPKIVTFRIQPPWWATWWFRTLYITAGLGLIYAYYQFRINQIRRKEQHLRELAEFENAVLRLQMNPHFIFNSLNSIQAYIAEKDTFTAQEYLARFGKLIRTILEKAKEPYLSITEEVELLELYLDTENIRLDQKMDYEIQIDDQIDEDELKLPTMLLQPFVENAIWHGISPKEGKGTITIHFTQKGNVLFIEIADNGIGRQAAKAQSQKRKRHQSMALEITRKRLAYLSDQGSKKASFEIKDRDENDPSSGTLVIVKIPLQ
ncbi:MAG: histidine kinase, partial [Bacteroidota bacterium]